MLLQRLLRPDQSGIAIERAWSGAHSERDIARINQCFGWICRIASMRDGDYEAGALPAAINDTVMARRSLRHTQFDILMQQPGATEANVPQTVYAIAPQSAMEAVKAYIHELARGGRRRDARFVQSCLQSNDDAFKTVGWIRVGGPVTYICTDKMMFDKFLAVTGATPYHAPITAQRPDAAGGQAQGQSPGNG